MKIQVASEEKQRGRSQANRDFEQMMENREFRSDLYYRLNVFPIRILPLRERPEDILLLVRYFRQKYGRRRTQKQIESIPGTALRKRSSWHWPGNIRELENFVERSAIMARRCKLLSRTRRQRQERTGDGHVRSQ
jgi:transcriptional regulator with GAF, ATPase, and Fis domain